MKAKDLIKKGMSIDKIYKDIEDKNNDGCCMLFIPKDMYVTDNVKLQLIEDGFSVRIGEFFRTEGLIIEW